MRSSTIALATAIALALAAPQAFADEAQEASNEPAQEESIASTDTESASAEAPAEAPAEQAGEASAVEAPTAGKAMALGPVGYDEQGRQGRIHIVVPGDTLWDISDAYLGTPWVWPSIWRDNRGIENPHLILPDDRIWITATEMRRVSEEEAARLLSAGPQGDEALPAAMEDASPLGNEEATPRRTYHFSEIDTAGFVSNEEFAGATTIVDSHEPRVWLGDADQVIIGRGAGDVEAGDQYEIFRPSERVFDPASGDVIGFATTQLGWLEVESVGAETSTGTIRLSRSEIQRGDHVLPRIKPDPEIEIGPKPDVEGRIIFTPHDRLNMGTGDLVYLDRGSNHGLAVGSPLEVYRSIGTAMEELQKKKVVLPDNVVASLLVVSVREDTAVAVVIETTVELSRGDRFRGSDSLDWIASR